MVKSPGLKLNPALSENYQAGPVLEKCKFVPALNLDPI